MLIDRDWYEIGRYRVTDAGACPDCNALLAGRFDGRAGNFGRRRLPLRIATQPR
jgi:pyruvate formate lyase activating enzyme